jgi:ADP-ribosylglycohydrolase
MFRGVPLPMLGAFVGDAVGAFLEFLPGRPTEEQVQRALTVPGGGCHRIGRGQITDDGELTLALWGALHKQKVPTSIMKAYADWYYSAPFDVGGTCANAFEIYVDAFDGTIPVESCAELVQSLNAGSEANGALMRATAIAAYTFLEGKGVWHGIELATQDALLSHPSVVCQEVNQIYVFAIIELLLRGHTDKTLSAVECFVEQRITSEKVRCWFYEESMDISEMDCVRQNGHVRWAFVMAMYFLRHPEISFHEALTMVLRKGGDTDTNAAIVGGLVACYQPIPDAFLDAVLLFDSTIQDRKSKIRPAEYCVKHVFLSSNKNR